jgi:ribosomal protein S18 acetylase RimI-like enzyme
LWVAPEHRSKGIGSSLVRAFEAHARKHGCAHFYLETFSFQAPHFYRTLGYQVAFELTVYPHGIVRFLMVKHDGAPDNAA